MHDSPLLQTGDSTLAAGGRRYNSAIFSPSNLDFARVIHAVLERYGRGDATSERSECL